MPVHLSATLPASHPLFRPPRDGSSSRGCDRPSCEPRRRRSSVRSNRRSVIRRLWGFGGARLGMGRPGPGERAPDDCTQHSRSSVVTEARTLPMHAHPVFSGTRATQCWRGYRMPPGCSGVEPALPARRVAPPWRLVLRRVGRLLWCAVDGAARYDLCASTTRPRRRSTWAGGPWK
jgi:hypothetical protein